MSKDTISPLRKARIRARVSITWLIFALDAAFQTQAVDGDLDTAFNPDVSGSVLCVVVQPDGKILLGGVFTNVLGQARNSVARLNADGGLDTEFNPELASVPGHYPFDEASVETLALQADGKILIGGSFIAMGAEMRTNIARLTPSGTLDTHFDAKIDSQVIRSVALQPDGAILLGGIFTAVGGQTHTNVARLNPDGVPDEPFSVSLQGWRPELLADAVVDAVLVQADNQILLGGKFTEVNGQPRSHLARLNAEGTLDPNFIPKVDGETVYTMTIQPDGKILVGSVDLFSTFYLVRLDPDGTRDSTFATNAGGSSYIYSIALQTDGRILVDGWINQIAGQTRQGLQRFNPGGTLDPTFEARQNGIGGSVALQSDGKILIGGQFTSVAGVTRSNLARLHNGSATQTLSAPDANTVQWLRGGTAPEVIQVAFELSTNNGTAWMPLGTGTRIAGGWKRPGLSLPVSALLRARGRTSDSVSSGLVEQVAAYGSFLNPGQTNGLFHTWFAGVPDHLHTIQSAPSLNGPWNILTNFPAGSTWLFEVYDSKEAPQRFYRVGVP